jgi:hypothetical protein
VMLRLPGPLSMPPDNVKVLLTVEVATVERIKRLPADNAIGSWLVRLLIESAAEELCVTVMPGMLMTTSSFTPGKTPALQLLAVSQSPPAGLIHETVDGSVLSSNPSKNNRLPPAFLRRTARLGKVD